MTSRGHRNPFDDNPGTERETSLPGTATAPLKLVSETVLPTGTAPGCHVTVARPSAVRRLPATPRRTVWLPVEAGGRGATTTRSVVAVVAEAEPPLPVAVTTSERVEPMSSGVSVRRVPVARGIAMQDVPAALQRRQRYVNFVGEPVHVPAELVRTCPAWGLPRICGGFRFVGRAAGALPAGATAVVGALAAFAGPVAEVEVTKTLSACPTSAATGR